MNPKSTNYLLLPVFCLILLSSCAPAPEKATPADPAKLYEELHISYADLLGPVSTVLYSEYEVEYDSVSRKVYKSEYNANGFMTLIEDYNSHGNFLERTEYVYNEKGYLVEQTFYEGNPDEYDHKNVMEVNELGQTLNEKKLDASGAVLDESVYTYNQAHEVTAITSSKYTATITYQHDTLPIREESTQKNGQHAVITYAYDEKGQMTEMERNIEEEGYKTYLRLVMSYDDKGNEVKQEIYEESHDNLTSVWVREYNAAGDETFFKRTDAEGNPILEIMTHYDESGKKIDTEEWTWNEAGEKIQEKFRSDEDRDKVDIENDAHKNWIKETTYYGQSDTLFEVRTREITYHN